MFREGSCGECRCVGGLGTCCCRGEGEVSECNPGGSVLSLVGRGCMGLTQLRSWEQREGRCCRAQCAVVAGQRQDRVHKEGLGLGERM